MKKQTKLMVAGVFALLVVVLIALVRLVDAASIGPEGTRIGLSHLNQAVHGLTGVHMIWYTITDWLGILAILVAAAFGVIGLMQLIRRRSLLKVDGEILALGGLYVVVIALYLFFEKVIVNYRPIIMPGSEHPEASFPSSHTMLVCVIMGSAIQVLHRYVRGRGLRKGLRAACWAVIGITVVGRLISGVHWFTDIVGGLLISAALLQLFSAITASFRRRARRKGKRGAPRQRRDE